MRPLPPGSQTGPHRGNRARAGRRAPTARSDRDLELAFGRSGAVAPSERIVLGGIGIGGRGSGVLRWMLAEKDVQFVAVCDAKKSQRENVKRMVDTHYGNKDCDTSGDLREFLATRGDIDVVLIATGDRWHVSLCADRMDFDIDGDGDRDADDAYSCRDEGTTGIGPLLESGQCPAFCP